MIGAIVKIDTVERLIVINEANIPEMEAALSCEIVSSWRLCTTRIGHCTACRSRLAIRIRRCRSLPHFVGKPG